MYTLVAYQQDYDSLEGPYIYQFATLEEADKAERELKLGNFSVEKEVRKYVEPTKFYELSTADVSGKVTLNIVERYGYHAVAERIPKLISQNATAWIGYHGYSKNKELLEDFKRIAEKQIEEYKRVEFVYRAEFHKYLYINQMVEKFVVEIDGWKFWSDGKIISKPKKANVSDIFAPISCSGTGGQLVKMDWGGIPLFGDNSK